MRSGFYVRINGAGTRPLAPNNIAHLGFAPEASVSVAEPYAYPIFHICLRDQCRLAGFSFVKGTAFRRATAVSFRSPRREAATIRANQIDNRANLPSASKIDAAPLLGHTKPAGPAGALRASPRSPVFCIKLFYTSMFIAFMGLLLKTGSLVKELDVGPPAYGKLGDGVAKCLEGCATSASTMASGIVRWLASALRKGYRVAYPWFIRVSVIALIVYEENGWGGHRGFPNPIPRNRSIKSGPPTRPPTPSIAFSLGDCLRL